MGIEEDNEALYRHFVAEAWNNRPPHVDVCYEVYSPNYLAHAWDGDPAHDVHGPEGHAEFINDYHVAFPDVHIELDKVIVKGDLLVAMLTASGTMDGPYMGVPPTGRPFSIQGFGLNRFENGKIVEAWGMVDRMGMLIQLGIMPTTELAAG